MGNSIDIKITGFDQLKKRISSMEQKLADDVSDILNVNVEDIVLHAKQLAPKDEGNLAMSISADKSKPFEKTIVANAPYAAFVEFGTGKYAAEYVSSLPDNWQQFAAQYKGLKGTGTAYDLWLALIDWVKRHGIATTKKYGVTKKGRTAKTSSQEASIAYLFMLKILKNGVKPQPFLYPAFRDQEDIIMKNFEELMKEF